MNNSLIYLAEVSCCFALFYMLYYFQFRRLSFHAINRGLLLLMLPLSFALPIMELGWCTAIIESPSLLFFEEWTQPAAGVASLEATFVSPEKTFSYLEILYWAGLVFCTIKLLLNIAKLLLLKRRSPSSRDDGFQFIAADIPAIFSCFHWIFIPKNQLHTYEPAVIDHEKAHARFWHSLDLVATEMAIVFLWFNPFIYFFRKSLKSVHEFQADQQVLRKGIKKSDYLLLMLNNLELRNQPFKLYNHFNQLTIKLRVNMITTTPSGKLQLGKYLLFGLITALLALAFTEFEGTPPTICPIKEGAYKDISLSFGKTFVHPTTKKKVVHGGIDIAAAEGVAVMATGDGTVKKAEDAAAWGNLIIIDHGNGYESWYAHLKDFVVEKGQTVKQGQTIGQVGTTGQSTGPHLHYEVRLNDERVNPMDYMGKKAE